MVPTPSLRLLFAPLVAVGLLGRDAAAQASPAPGPGDGLLVARQSVHPTGFPRILILDAPGSDLVTFRLSVPLEGGVEVSAAAPILQRMAEGRYRGAAATLGAQVEAGASASALSYTVTGARADLDHLTFLLRQATQAPRASEGFAAARGELEARLARVGETGEGRVEAELRARAAPGEASIADVRTRLRTFTFADLEAAWRASHVPDRMTLVVVGDVATPVLLAALSGLGATPPPDPPTAPLRPSAPAQDRPDLLKRWIGFAWSSAPTFDPRAVVAASLAARHLREGRNGYEAYVRLWEGRDQDILAVVGSAYGNQATALRRRLAGLPAELAGSLDEAELADVVRGLHWNLLAQARTPWGRANLVGRFLETGGPPDAARQYLDALLALDVEQVRSFLQGLASAPSVTAEEGR